MELSFYSKECSIIDIALEPKFYKMPVYLLFLSLAT